MPLRCRSVRKIKSDWISVKHNFQRRKTSLNEHVGKVRGDAGGCCMVIMNMEFATKKERGFLNSQQLMAVMANTYRKERIERLITFSGYCVVMTSDMQETASSFGESFPGSTGLFLRFCIPSEHGDHFL